jgi:APA family basic amino acid/polyamine antiporter
VSDPGQESAPAASLQRTVGLFGAVVLGLGSIVGTGVFFSLALVVGQTGEFTPLAVLLAGLLALCNGLSSAQLAAAHPVSGGSYEYGYRYLNPKLGFLAGWMFLVAKGASAATAAAIFAIYLSRLVPAVAKFDMKITATAAVVAMTVLVLSGLKRSVRANAVLVGISVLALAAFVLHGLSIEVPPPAADSVRPFSGPTFLHGTALLFVAFTGYGRVATMGEEIRDPARNIPIAVALTVGASALIYVVVAFVLVRLSSNGSAGASLFDLSATAPQWLRILIVVGAVTAMLGVLMNLLLGLSRVVLAMARRGDLPPSLSVLNKNGESPNRAVILVAAGIVALILISSHPRMTWSLSAMTVLIYYATANLCALRQPVEERRFPKIVSLAGLGGSLLLVIWIPFWFVGLVLIAGGLAWHVIAQRVFSGRGDS